MDQSTSFEGGLSPRDTENQQTTERAGLSVVVPVVPRQLGDIASLKGTAANRRVSTECSGASAERPRAVDARAECAVRPDLCVGIFPSPKGKSKESTNVIGTTSVADLVTPEGCTQAELRPGVEAPPGFLHTAMCDESTLSVECAERATATAQSCCLVLQEELSVPFLGIDDDDIGFLCTCWYSGSPPPCSSFASPLIECLPTPRERFKRKNALRKLLRQAVRIPLPDEIPCVSPSHIDSKTPSSSDATYPRLWREEPYVHRRYDGKLFVIDCYNVCASVRAMSLAATRLVERLVRSGVPLHHHVVTALMDSAFARRCRENEEHLHRESIALNESALRSAMLADFLDTKRRIRTVDRRAERRRSAAALRADMHALRLFSRGPARHRRHRCRHPLSPAMTRGVRQRIVATPPSSPRRRLSPRSRKYRGKPLRLLAGGKPPQTTTTAVPRDNGIRSLTTTNFRRGTARGFNTVNDFDFGITPRIRVQVDGKEQTVGLNDFLHLLTNFSPPRLRTLRPYPWAVDPVEIPSVTAFANSCFYDSIARSIPTAHLQAILPAHRGSWDGPELRRLFLHNADWKALDLRRVVYLQHESSTGGDIGRAGTVTELLRMCPVFTEADVVQQHVSGDYRWALARASGAMADDLEMLLASMFFDIHVQIFSPTHRVQHGHGPVCLVRLLNQHCTPMWPRGVNGPECPTEFPCFTPGTFDSSSVGPASTTTDLPVSGKRAWEKIDILQADGIDETHLLLDGEPALRETPAEQSMDLDAAVIYNHFHRPVPFFASANPKQHNEWFVLHVPNECVNFTRLVRDLCHCRLTRPFVPESRNSSLFDTGLHVIDTQDGNHAIVPSIDWVSLTTRLFAKIFLSRCLTSIVIEPILTPIASLFVPDCVTFTAGAIAWALSLSEVIGVWNFSRTWMLGATGSVGVAYDMSRHHAAPILRDTYYNRLIMWWMRHTQSAQILPYAFQEIAQSDNGHVSQITQAYVEAQHGFAALPTCTASIPADIARTIIKRATSRNITAEEILSNVSTILSAVDAPDKKGRARFTGMEPREFGRLRNACLEFFHHCASLNGYNAHERYDAPPKPLFVPGVSAGRPMGLLGRFRLSGVSQRPVRVLGRFRLFGTQSRPMIRLGPVGASATAAPNRPKYFRPIRSYYAASQQMQIVAHARTPHNLFTRTADDNERHAFETADFGVHPMPSEHLLQIMHPSRRHVSDAGFPGDGYRGNYEFYRSDLIAFYARVHITTHIRIRIPALPDDVCRIVESYLYQSCDLTVMIAGNYRQPYTRGTQIERAVACLIHQAANDTSANPTDPCFELNDMYANDGFLETEPLLHCQVIYHGASSASCMRFHCGERHIHFPPLNDDVTRVFPAHNYCFIPPDEPLYQFSISCGQYQTSRWPLICSDATMGWLSFDWGLATTRRERLGDNDYFAAMVCRMFRASSHLTTGPELHYASFRRDQHEMRVHVSNHARPTFPVVAQATFVHCPIRCVAFIPANPTRKRVMTKKEFADAFGKSGQPPHPGPTCEACGTISKSRHVCHNFHEKHHSCGMPYVRVVQPFTHRYCPKCHNTELAANALSHLLASPMATTYRSGVFRMTRCLPFAPPTRDALKEAATDPMVRFVEDRYGQTVSFFATKRKFLPQLVAIGFLDRIPFVTRVSPESVRSTLLGRALVPPYEAPELWRLQREADLFIKEFLEERQGQKVRPTPFFEWNQRFPKHKQNQHYAARADLSNAKYDRRWWERKFFLKSEKLLKDLEVEPYAGRAISSVSAHAQALLGPIMHAFGQALKHHWSFPHAAAHPHEITVVYASGMNPEEVGGGFQSLHDAGMRDLRGFDYSKYDSSFQYDHLLILHKIITSVCEFSPMARTAYAHQLRSHARFLIDNKTVSEFFFLGRRNSGDANTSCENTLANGLTNMASYRKRGWCGTAVVCGDDTAHVRRRIEPDDAADFMSDVASMGFKATKDDCDQLIGAKFLGGVITPVLDHQSREKWILVPDLRRCLPKIGWSLEWREATHDWARSVALAYRDVFACTPIMCEYVNAVLRATGGRSGVFRTDAQLMRVAKRDKDMPQIIRAAGLSFRPRAHPDCMHNFTRAYNITVDEVNFLESQLREVEVLPILMEAACCRPLFAAD